MFKGILAGIYLFVAICFSASAIAAPSAPSWVKATIYNGNDITISWSSVSGATKYTREARVNNGSWVNDRQYTSTSVTVPDAPLNTYQYRVRACNSTGCSGWTYSNSVTVFPPAPSQVSAVIYNGNDITINWSSVSGATRYTRQARVNSGAWVNDTSYTSTTVTMQDAPPATYQYRVRSCSAQGCPDTWTYSNSVTVVVKPKAPTNVNAEISNGDDVKTSWKHENTTNVAYYYKEFRFNGGSYANRKIVYGLGETENNRAAGTYQYRLQACNSAGCSEWAYSSQIRVLPVPTNVKAVLDWKEDIFLSWGGSTYATHYLRQVRENDGAWKNETSHNITSFTYSNVYDGKFQYRIKTCDSQSCTNWVESNALTVVLKPKPLASVTAAVSGDDITVSWQLVAGATNVDNFQKQVSFNGGAFTGTKTVTTQSDVDANQAVGKYVYRVNACNEVGCSSWVTSNEVSVLGVPQNVTARFTTAILLLCLGWAIMPQLTISAKPE